MQMKMDIERCFEILELERDASPDEVKQAYKDIVNVWHPDRFLNNPRLKHKADEKLKEINIAYETLNSYLASKQDSETGQEGTKIREDVDNGPQKTKTYDTTEAIVEAGTGIVLSLWAYLSSVCQRIIEDVKTEIGQEKMSHKQREAGRRGEGKGRGMGRGRSMDSGGGDRGRDRN